ETPDRTPLGLVTPHGYPKARAKDVEPCRHDPDKNSWSVAQNKGFSENCRIATKFLLPESVVHYKHGRSTGAPIFLRDRAAQQRRYAQIVESVGCYGRTARQNAGEFAIIIEEAAHRAMRDHVFEDMILIAKGAEFIG